MENIYHLNHHDFYEVWALLLLFWKNKRKKLNNTVKVNKACDYLNMGMNQKHFISFVIAVFSHFLVYILYMLSAQMAGYASFLCYIY